jgi:hypothetical protein
MTDEEHYGILKQISESPKISETLNWFFDKEIDNLLDMEKLPDVNFEVQGKAQLLAVKIVKDLKSRLFLRPEKVVKKDNYL